jgi:hypothetical protein
MPILHFEHPSDGHRERLVVLFMPAFIAWPRLADARRLYYVRPLSPEGVQAQF